MSNPSTPPAIIIGIGPILKNSDATAAAANNTQLIQSGKLSLTSSTAGLAEDQSTLNISMIAAAPIRPIAAGLIQLSTPLKSLFPLNLV